MPHNVLCCDLLVLERSRADHKYAFMQVHDTGESEAIGTRPCQVIQLNV